MKKFMWFGLPALIVFALIVFKVTDTIWSEGREAGANGLRLESADQGDRKGYKFPRFYKGFYLTTEAGANMKKLEPFIEKAKAAGLNTVVLDVQNSRFSECMVPAENIEYLVKNGFHPIARVVVFPDGLKSFPVPEAAIQDKIALAENACKNGFKEIQFDYIRFNDFGVLRQLTLQQKYDFIQGFLARAKKSLEKYDVKIAADIFGRIPLNKQDEIGQNMEVFDKVVDVICPMAYPSHYTWSMDLMSNPYQTVFITSKRARERVKNADIVTYIQAFKYKHDLSKLTFEKYIEEQIRGVHDSEVRGYLLWNARHEYDTAFDVVKEYYSKEASRVSKVSNRNKAESSSI